MLFSLVRVCIYYIASNLSNVCDLIAIIKSHITKSYLLFTNSCLLISGHLLYEMLAGYELTTAEPKQEHLMNFRNAPVVEV